MGLLLRLRLRHAAKRYASRLGPLLSKAYGASEAYTPAQIRAGVSKLGLNSRFIALGYAAFLDETTYANLLPEVPVCIPFLEARRLFEEFRPTSLFSASSNTERSLNFIEAGYSDHGGSS
jgi:hypothetical protein